MGILDWWRKRRAPVTPSRDVVLEIPPLSGPKEPAPVALRLAIGRFADRGDPVPFDWALAWAWYHPKIFPRTPAMRCQDEFSRLFAIRYHAQFGDGLVMNAERNSRKGANAPDIYSPRTPADHLIPLFASVTEELDPYSRWLGRNPGKAGSLAGLALLPPELGDANRGETRELVVWINGLLGARGIAETTGGELMRFWPSSSPDKLTRAESLAFAQALGRLGFGIEPDVRFDGPVITRSEPVVLFRTASTLDTLTASYAIATLLVRLAAVVGAADGNTSGEEISQLRASMDGSLQLTEAERARLDAHLAWLAATEIKLTGLRKRIDLLSPSQREGIGDVLIAVAAADGAVSPAEVTALMKIYKLLGLDQEVVTSRLHTRLTTSKATNVTRTPSADVRVRQRTRPASGPVTVRPAGPADPGYRLPPRPASLNVDQPSSVEPPPIAPEQPGGFALDPHVIQQKIADTEEVMVLLGSIFAEVDETDVLQWNATVSDAPRVTAGSDQTAESNDLDAADTAMGRDAEPGESIADLDLVHSALLRELVTKETWDRSEFETLADRHGLMPNGALDMLNEAAYAVAEEPLIEGDDPLTINPYARQALFA